MHSRRWILIALAIASPSLTGCSSLLFGVANVPTYFSSQLRGRDVRYGEKARQQLDVYAPEHAQHAAVVIFWHGGSWSTGDKANYRFVGNALAKRGYVAVLPNYRLHPAVKFPVFMHDAAAAVAWAELHAQEYGGDPRRIVVMGHSAGAQIATLVAYDEQYLLQEHADPKGIRGVIGLSGPYALDPDSDLLREIFTQPYEHKDWQPLAFVDGAVPPTLLLHGRKDDVVRVSHLEKLAAALEHAGAHVETEVYPDVGHSAMVASFAWLSLARVSVIDRAARFIDGVTTFRSP